jgi:predicted nucleotidyltransferase
MNNSKIIAAISKDCRYRQIALPFEIGKTEQQVKDAEFLIRKDGTIFNVEGWYHPAGYVVGEVLYAPDEKGDKYIFGQRYRKVTLYPGTYKPIPYPDRAKVLKEIDPQFDQTEINPFFAKYKQILPVTDFVAYLPSSRALKRALAQSNGHTKFYVDFVNLINLLGLRIDEISLGLTGAPLLGNTGRYHDLDVVFSGNLNKNLQIAKTMRDLAINEPWRRLFEGGKAWQIRFFNDLKTLICTFFTYSKHSDAPLRDFSMEILEKGVVAQGGVSDDTHSMYTPTILQLKDVTIMKNYRLIQRYANLPIIVYHTASRGDCFNNDIVQASGALVEIKQADKGIYPAICVIDREGLRNISPPWEGYYRE